MLRTRIGMIGRISLDANSSVPLYRQLSDRIAELIRSGALPDGERIPPTRELASQIGLNRTTVSAAYGLLEAEGLIQGHVGRGSFVRYQGSRTSADAADAMVSFASSRPADQEFPLSEFQQSAREVLLSAEASRVLQLGAPAGYPALRRWLLERAEAEGSRHANDEVLVTNGCQQGLDLIQRTLAPAGTTAVIEDPVYHGVRNVFARVGVKLAGLPVGSGGVDPEHLARVCEAERPAVVVVTPDFQNPCGATMPLEAREAVVQLARKFGFVLVENSIYRETRYIGTALPSLKQLDRDGGTVVSLGSFSKIAFPGLRVGWVLGPGALIARLTEARQWCDLHTDHLSQAILLRFADSGRLSRHVESVRENGRVRLQRVIGSLERHMPSDAAWTRPEGGFNLWLRLPGGLDAADLLPWAEQAGVSYLPGIYFRVGPGDCHALRLSFGALSPESIERGVITLARVCRERLSGRPGDRDVFDAAAAVV